MQQRTLRSDLLLLMTAAIWGLAFSFQRLGMDHVGPLTFTGARFLLGAFSLLPVLLVYRGYHRRYHPASPLPSLANSQLIFGGLGLGLILFVGSTLQQFALLYTTAGKAAFITGLYIVIVPVLGLFWRQPTRPNTWLGVGLGVTGLYLLSVNADFTISFGDLLVLISAFFWAGHLLLIGRLSPHQDPIALSMIQFACCGILSTAAALMFETVDWQSLQAASSAIFYTGVISVGIAYTLQVIAQKEAPPAHAAIILSMETVFGAIGGWLLLGELLSNRALLGCTLMFAGMLASQLNILRLPRSGPANS